MRDEGKKDPAPSPAPGKRPGAKFAPLEPRPEQAPLPRWILPVVMVTLLTVGGWFIIQNLADTSKMEDCTMAGRHNCVPPIDTSKMGK
jgi:hypothetical protein